MELIQGEPIDYYSRSRGLPLAARIDLFTKICDAVEYANQRHVINCDIKPGNILAPSDGVPKLLDFGISRLVAGEHEITGTLARAATPEYASPEQLRGGELTSATDIYSLGAVLRKLIVDLPGIPPALTRVVTKATHFSPDQRYASAADLSAAVRQSVTPHWTRRGLVGALAGGGAVVAAGGVTWFMRRDPVLAHNHALAVMRIENHTGDRDLDWVDRGLADLLATNFAQAGGFEVISTARSRELLARMNNDQRKAADAAHADYYVTGDLWRVGPGLRLNLRVEHSASGHIRVAEKFDADSPQALVALADQASSALLSQLRADTTALPSAGRALSANADALRLYEQGCDYLERFLIPKARESLRRAVEIDPRFAMAYFRLGETDPWNPPSARRDFERASELATRLQLPPRDRQLLESATLDIAGRSQEAAAIVRLVVRQKPGDVEARIALAMALWKEWYFPAAFKAGQEAILIDPNWRIANLTMAYSAALTGSFSEAHMYSDRYIASLQPGDWNGLDLRGDLFGLAERFDEAIVTYEKVHRWAKIALAAMHKGDFDRAEGLMKEAVARRGGPVAMGGWLGFLGDIQVGRGDLDGARTWFEQGIRAYADYSWFGGMVLWKAAQVYLEKRSPETVLDLTGSLATHPWSSRVRAVALLALGKTADAESSLAAMRTSIGALLGNYMAARYEELHRLLGAFYRNEHDKVLSIADHVPPNRWIFSALAAGRSSLALGNLDAAERHLLLARKTQLWFGQVGLYEGHNLLAFLLGEFYLGQLAMRRGRKDEAIRKFDFFLQHFRHSTARLPQIKEAEAALRS